MTNTAEGEHQLEVGASNHAVATGKPPASEPDKVPLLDWLEQLAATAFVGPGSKESATAVVSDSAAALTGSDRKEAAVDLLGREIAVCKAQLDFLNAALGTELTSGGDRQSLECLDRLTLNATKRLTMLLAEYRATAMMPALAGAPSVIVVGQADAVHVGTGR